ncbi:DUF2920 family protein [Neobacillus sp.]|uniref:DUF2920 family protein n=1 Tax=Neobacillus sp. TaxID=2675273 RepID=UPI00289BD4CF|nr:DUF2920 family protein [Neobacillus sp.]
MKGAKSKCKGLFTMSKDYELRWPGHPNIYCNGGPRDFTFYFSEPDGGVNSETGILLLIPGFGASSRSNVYKKMRSVFADQYNLVTVQCDYFGQEFMQGSQTVNLNYSKEKLASIFTRMEFERICSNGFDINAFLEIGSNYNLNISVKEVLNETMENFNDMGIMQAIDNLIALHYVIKIIEDNQFVFNREKIILFGQSHGAYLSYLCNALAPHLFSLLIDNSAWIFPAYLKSSRYLTTKIGKMTLQTEFEYLAAKLDLDETFLNLRLLYRLFENNCKIVCYHGTNDNLITNIEKQSFCDEVAHCLYNEIGPKEIDGNIFKSTSHGLDADFLAFFSHVFEGISFEYSEKSMAKSVQIKTDKYVYDVSYETGMPIVTLTKSIV